MMIFTLYEHFTKKDDQISIVNDVQKSVFSIFDKLQMFTVLRDVNRENEWDITPPASENFVFFEHQNRNKKCSQD